MVLPGQTILASSTHFHLSEVAASAIAIYNLSAATARINGFDRLVVPAGKSGARRILCGCILRDLIVSGARVF